MTAIDDRPIQDPPAQTTNGQPVRRSALSYPKASVFSDARKRKLIAAHLQIRVEQLSADGNDGAALANQFVADILADASAELQR